LADGSSAMDTVDSGSTSEVEDQPKTWGSDARTLVPQGADDASNAHPQSDCGIGHRVLASRSVLALVIDEECVFAGLQGGDIVVSSMSIDSKLLDLAA
jgi:di- and tripeptidase